MWSRRAFSGAGAAFLVIPSVTRSARASDLRVRRDVMELADDDPFFAKYADAVSAMHRLPESDGRNWRRQARIHADFCKHGELQFLHWHRHYITYFETICGELVGDRTFALPYWNWTKKGGVIPTPFFDISALNVESWNDPGRHNSANWGPVDSVGRRGLTRGRGLLDDPVRGGAFTSATIAGIMRLTRSSLFQNSLEGSPHNNAHVVVGATAAGRTGHMGDGLSPLDPIFWLHHCMVDRVWAEWQRAGNTTTAPDVTYTDNFFDVAGGAAVATARGALDTTALGYTYDVLQPTTTTAAPAHGPLVEGIVPGIQTALQDQRPPKRLGAAATGDVSAPRVATTLKVPAPGLLRALESEHPFRDLSLSRAPSVNLESGRILARFTQVVPPENKTDLVVNVFINCPYLSPETRYVDPHYAGTFSFFGHAEHAAHGRAFTIDITEPVRKLAKEGRLKEEKLNVQLMPLPAYIEGKSESTFQAGQVEIIAV